MAQFHRAFDRTLNEFNISGKWLAEKSGVATSTISLFRNNQQSMKAEVLEKLIEVLPEEARIFFFTQMQPRQFDPKKMSTAAILDLLDLDIEGAADVLQELSVWLRNSARQTQKPMPRDRLEYLVEALLEVNADGVLVIEQSEIIHFNSQFVAIWNPPKEILRSRDDRQLANYQQTLVVHGQEFIDSIEEECRVPDIERDTIIYLKDGRRMLRTSKPFFIKGEFIGRIVSYRLL